MFRFRDRWQTSLGPLYRDHVIPSSTDALLALLESRDRDLEDYLNGSVDWTAPTFENGWTNYDPATHFAVGFRRRGDTVQLRGSARSGTLNVAVFTLPVGFRPPRVCRFSSPDGAVDVTTAGAVRLFGASNTIFSIDDISFSVTP